MTAKNRDVEMRKGFDCSKGEIPKLLTSPATVSANGGIPGMRARQVSFHHLMALRLKEAKG